MLIPLKIIFRGIPAFDTVAERIRKRAANLNRFSDYLHGCRVTIDSAGRHRQRGVLWVVRIDLAIAGGDLVIDRGHHHEDIDMLVNDAFDAAAKVLQAHTTQRTRTLAKMPQTSYGRVTKLFP